MNPGSMIVTPFQAAFGGFRRNGSIEDTGSSGLFRLRDGRTMRRGLLFFLLAGRSHESKRA
jgi:hypothetical protein